MKPHQDSQLVALARAIERSPRYFYEFAIGLLIALIGDQLVTALAIGSVFVGLIFGFKAALAVFFLLWVLMHTITTISSALSLVGQRMIQAAQVRQPPPTSNDF